VVLSVNPYAGRWSAEQRVEQVAALLRKEQYQVDVATSLDRAVALAVEAYRAGTLRVLVGVGGDGTAGELVNRTPPGLPLTFLPTGTANLLAKHFRLSARPDRFVQLIGQGELVRIDAGRAGNRLFVLMASCGFDAHVAARVHLQRQGNRRGGHIGYTSYLRPIWQTTCSYRFPALCVTCEQIHPEGKNTVEQWDARWVFISNFPRYGWGIRIAPRAAPDDGLLDLCTFSGGSPWRGLWYATCVQFGGAHRLLPDCRMRRGRRFRITGPETVQYQLDGDPGGTLPVEIEVLAGRVTLLVPPGGAEKR